LLLNHLIEGLHRRSFAWVVWSAPAEGLASALTTLVNLDSARGVRVSHWIVAHIGIEVRPFVRAHWIFGDEPSCLRVVVTRPVKVDVGLGVELAGRVAERVGQGARRRGQLSEGVVGVGIRQRPSTVAYCF
jgi:hypothetical protein